MRLINRRPDRGTATLLASLPFVVLAGLYLGASALRLQANPADKLLPSLSAMGQSIYRMAVLPDPRTGQVQLWADSWASLERLGLGLGVAVVLTLLLGLVIGMLPYARALLASVVDVISMVPPLALLPILFIVLGLGEVSKVTLIVIGVMPGMIRDLSLRVQELPREQMTKALTLGASSWQVAIRVVLPQVMPRLLTSLRLQLGPAWLFLIAAEAISAEAGLGYRIFLVRRFLAMDVIFPYVAWITLLAVAMNWGLEWVRRRLFPWADLQ